MPIWLVSFPSQLPRTTNLPSFLDVVCKGNLTVWSFVSGLLLFSVVFSKTRALFLFVVQ